MLRKSRFLLLIICALGAPAFAQQIKLSASSLEFASQTPTAPQTITLSNIGAADVTVRTVVASGGFSQTNDCSTLRPGQSCSIDVAFISTIVGTTSGVLTVSDSSSSSPEIVNLIGTLAAPISLSPASLNFGGVAVGTTVTRSVTLSANAGAFSIASITTTGDYTQSNNCPATLAVGQSCTVHVSFRPKANGVRAGVLAVTSNDPGFSGPLSGFTTALSGSGTGGQAGHVSLQPVSLSFGVKTALDIFQHTRAVKLTNTSSNTSLTIHGVSVAGPIYNLTPMYQVASTNCAGILAPGAQCEVRVKQNPPDNAFAPQSAAGSLTISDGDNSSPDVVPLSTSIRPELGFTPATVTFPAQPVGTTSAPKIVVVSYNPDRDGLSLAPMTVTSGFNLVPAGARPCGLEPSFNAGQSCTVGVTFTPPHTGTINGAVTFTMYPECDPQSVAIDHLPCPQAQVINLSGTGD